MGRNLPPGVSVSDLPGNEPVPDPECEVRGCDTFPSTEAMEDGYPLCGPHDTPTNRAAIDEEIARRSEEATARHLEQRAERDRPPVEDEPLPTPLVPREVVEEQEGDTDT